MNWALPLALAAAVSLLPFRVTLSERLADSLRAEPVQAVHPPLARRAVLIVVDGLGANAAFHDGWMPRLQARRASAAWGVAWASFPTITSSGLCSIVSGHRVRPAVEVPGGVGLHREPDSVLARASSAGRRVVVIGQQYWEEAFAGHGARLEITPFAGPPLNHDEIERELALRELRGRSGRWDVLILHLFDLDPLGHLQGVGGPEYRRKLLWLDRTIDELSRLAGPETAILVTADHGQTWQGTHGGTERDERRVPFVCWGAGVRPGALRDLQLRDVAPTFAALVGVPPPSNSAGWPALEAFRLAPPERAAVLLELAEQRHRLWLAARKEWPWLPARAGRLLEEARRLAAAKEYERAAEAAAASARETGAAIDDSAPQSWASRSLLSLAFLAAGTTFALVWRASAGLRAAAWTAAALYLAALAGPMLDPSWWPPLSWLGLLSAAALLAAAALPGLAEPAMPWAEWGLWWLALAGLALPEVLDVRLWAWSVTFCFAARDALRGRSGRRLWGLAAFAIAAVLMAWFPNDAMSLLRSWMPALDLRGLARLPLEPSAWAVSCAAAALLAREIRTWAPPGRAERYGAAALLPLLAALPPGRPLAAVWAAAAASAVVACLTPMPRRLRASWLSLLLLAAARPVVETHDFLFTALAVIAAWGFAAGGAGERPLWRGLRWVAFCLWAYTLPVDRLDLSHVSVLEPFEAAGGWQPRLMLWLFVADDVLVLWAPMLPLLAEETLESFLAGLPPLAAYSLGGLLMAWFHVFFLRSRTHSMLDDRGYQSALWAAILGWLLAAGWLLARAAGGSKPVPDLSQDPRP